MVDRRRVIGIVAGLALAGLWIGVVQAEYQTTLHDGDRVDLTGEVNGEWLTVTEGSYATQRFELVKNRALENLHRQAMAGANVRIIGQVLEYEGTYRVLISSASPVASTPRAETPHYRQGSAGSSSDSSSGSYREGS